MGIPKTTNVGEPKVIIEPPVYAATTNEVLLVFGCVENENDEPPEMEVSTIEGLEVEEAVKSETKPVVAPLIPETVIVQLIDVATRRGFAGVHERVDAVIG